MIIEPPMGKVGWEAKLHDRTRETSRSQDQVSENDHAATKIINNWSNDKSVIKADNSLIIKLLMSINNLFILASVQNQ